MGRGAWHPQVQPRHRRRAIGEIEEVAPGAVKKLTLTLPAGRFALICKLTKHYGKGQVVDFYARG